MEKLIAPENVVAQSDETPLEDREYVEVELMRDGHDTARLAAPPAVIDEVVRRANEALNSPDGGVSREAAVASARAAALETRSTKS